MLKINKKKTKQNEKENILYFEDTMATKMSDNVRTLKLPNQEFKPTSD